MGACNIDFELKGMATREAIEDAFDTRKRSDTTQNGRHSYSGDFQTVSYVDFTYLGEIIDGYHKAYDLCLDKAEKWETVIAVYYKTHRGEINTLVAGWGAE